MWILALDASLARCSAALMMDGVIRAHRALATERGHAAALPAMAAEVLAEAGVRGPDLDAVAAVVGPGGFTGLRAALSLAEGLALASGVPAIGVTTGEALAAALPPALRGGREVWAVVDGRRGRVLLERFAPGAATPEAPCLLGEAELPRPPQPPVLAGDAAEAVAGWLAARGEAAVLAPARQPDAADAARVAALRLSGRLPPRPARPLYGEPPAVRPPAAPG
ncbi:tRNA (adenosine(37)-N6)-threonylcarbamoyltransferase complex dimerization subunit type 1 TsaB [Crenalkalicoccus roseus]|uniref:tRNA (adenosine(37)-N6)-threonylcarbamoyltransferase complex dimerization subunit type 1 TsaB n=1 Tax=Crenalkalicoccus roseus TaxID=1485588 RepID=UPI0013051187|nr:tRNA (adenosine(37)-N6)-threonylcarbamoyltransferase complex dimerization subunit type 1 TsaB [Crenalkalicoccus roseus]